MPCHVLACAAASSNQAATVLCFSRHGGRPGGRAPNGVCLLPQQPCGNPGHLAARALPRAHRPEQVHSGPAAEVHVRLLPALQPWEGHVTTATHHVLFNTTRKGNNKRALISTAHIEPERGSQSASHRTSMQCCILATLQPRLRQYLLIFFCTYPLHVVHAPNSTSGTGWVPAKQCVALAGLCAPVCIAAPLHCSAGWVLASMLQLPAHWNAPNDNAGNHLLLIKPVQNADAPMLPEIYFLPAK